MSTEEIIPLLIAYRYYLLFPMIVLEGPIFSIIAGFLVSLHFFNIYSAFIVVVLGDILGDIIYYFLGYYGRPTLIKKVGKFFRISIDQVKKMEKHFENHAFKTLVIGKLTHGVGTVFLLAAGIVRVPFWKFLWFDIIPTIPKSVLLILIGFYFGESYNRINTYLDYTAIGSIALFLVLIVVYFSIKKFARKIDKDLEIKNINLPKDE